MGQIRLLLLLALVATTLGIAQDSRSNTAPAADASSAPAIVNQNPQQTLRILAPLSGQTLAANFVDLRFELVTPAMSGQPNFILQLDAADPIHTSNTAYTFPDLQPGVHSVRVTLVDANNSPIPGGTATVQFRIPAANTPARTDGPRGAKRQTANRTIAGSAPAAPIPPELRNDGDMNLPLAGSPLPLLSIIGFGLLIGGAAHTMRSR